MNIAEHLKTIQGHISQACSSAGRAPDDVRLVAVSKKQPDTRIDEALAAEIRCFGENRVQEAQKRWQSRRMDHPDLRLHLIGPLQSNKAADAVALFDEIESLDRPKIARALAKEMEKQNRHLPCLIQVNTGEEPQKSGILPQDLPALLKESRDLGLNVMGLMCIPPLDAPPALHFALLKKLAETYGLKGLSMGMSHDYETAVALGATRVRVGSLLFGSREK